MSLKSELRKEGIEVIKQLNILKINSIATNISKKLINSFPEQNFNYHELFKKISSLNMYVAKMPNGIAAKYFYKNSSIYFAESTDLENLNEVAIHECIHAIQSKVNSKNKLLTLGLCDFKDNDLSGMALNEAAVQLMTMKCAKSKFDIVKYFDIELPSNSPDYYTLECNLVRQMAYITGEYVLYNSTIYGNNMFENKFIGLTSKKDFEIIKNNLNSIMYLEDELNYISEKIQNSDSVNLKLLKKSTKLKKEINNLFFTTQNKIFTSFFDKLFQSLYTPKSFENFRKAIYTYKNFIGTTKDYIFFKEYYINKLSLLEEKYNNMLNKQLALIPIKNSLIDKIIKNLKYIFDFNKVSYNDYNINIK